MNFISKILKEANKDNYFFLPIDIDKRKQQEKERFNKIVNNIKIGLNDLKIAKSSDPNEQLFIDLFKDLIIKINYDEYPNCIFLCNNNKQQFAEYDSKNNTFYYSYKHVWSVFNNRFSNTFKVFDIIKSQTEKYFKLNEISIKLSPRS